MLLYLTNRNGVRQRIRVSYLICARYTESYLRKRGKSDVDLDFAGNEPLLQPLELMHVALGRNHGLAHILSIYPIIENIIPHTHQSTLVSLMLTSKAVRNALLVSIGGSLEPFRNNDCSTAVSDLQCIACQIRVCTVRCSLLLNTISSLTRASIPFKLLFRP